MPGHKSNLSYGSTCSCHNMWMAYKCSCNALIHEIVYKAEQYVANMSEDASRHPGEKTVNNFHYIINQ